VAIVAPQGLDYVVGFLGSLCAGAIAVPLFPPDLPGHGEKLAAVLADAQPSLAISAPDQREAVAAFCTGHGSTSPVRVMSVEGLVRTATDPKYRDFFAEYGVKVRFYGDYRDVLTGTSYEYALKAMYEVTEATRQNSRFHLFFGVFADESLETVARLSVEHYLAQGVIPDKQTLVRKYYGEDVLPVDLFIGFDKFSAFDMPLLSTGAEDLYFSVSPSPYMTERQLRTILYDHLYLRCVPEPDYTNLSADQLDWLRDFYRRNQDAVLGAGRLKFGLWLPHTLEENHGKPD